MSQSKAIDCEVLVVGAGPTGLMAAGLLKRQGVDVRIVDERAAASPESRAFAIQARTLELFQQIGVVDAFLEQGIVNPEIEFFVGGKRVGGLDYDRADATDTPYPFMLLLPQSQTEGILIDDLKRLGMTVERSTQVENLEQDANGVTVHAVGANGAPVTLRSSYVIGADGAHSAVRHALGLAFEGAKYPQNFLLADAKVEWPLDHSRFRVFMHGDLIGLFLPLDGDRCSRVMATDRSAQAADEAQPMDLSELQAAFSQASGMQVTLSNPVWATRYRVHHRGVDRYASGRVFVAGDAAHIHSPAGGQGMNTGLQDAANLAWKLAVVLRGAPAALLDSYDAERRPVGAEVVAASDKLFTAAAGQSGWEATLRDWLAVPASAIVSKSHAIQNKAFRTLSELDIAYGPGDWAEDAAPELEGPTPGQRAPNARLTHHQDVSDLVGGYRFHVLAMSRKPMQPDEVNAIDNQLLGLQSAQCATHLVARLVKGTDQRVTLATMPEAFNVYGLPAHDGQAIYLIRPDGYIAWRANWLDVQGCWRFLSRFMLV